MPLQLGGVDTMRPQVISWDPTIYDQLTEAAEEIKRLENQGFTIDYEEDGEARLIPPAKDPNVGVFRILSQNGDDRIVWDRRIKDQVKEAFKKFKELIAKGYAAYAATSDGNRGHKITEFDPGLEEIILIPKTVPG
jgi:ABC-type glycerol-3-phosphate transport system substrate-binding protein